MAENKHEGHRERLRNRFIKDGLDSFEPHNVLELMLFYALPRRDTNELAHTLLERYGSFSEVLQAPVHELESVPGMGRNAAVFLSLIPAIQRYYVNDKMNMGKIQGMAALENYIFNRFTGLTEEHVLFLCLDNSLKLISADFISEGSVTSTIVNVRKLVDLSLRHNAVAAILAHNHPRGEPFPSLEDIETTKTVISALKTINVQLIDHIICNDIEYVNMTEYDESSDIFI